VLDRTRDRGHDRVEHRTLKAVSVHRFGFPHAAQVLQVTRKTRALASKPCPYRLTGVGNRRSQRPADAELTSVPYRSVMGLFVWSFVA
jgi:hypothetical protein